MHRYHQPTHVGEIGEKSYGNLQIPCRDPRWQGKSQYLEADVYIYITSKNDDIPMIFSLSNDIPFYSPRILRLYSSDIPVVVPLVC